MKAMSRVVFGLFCCAVIGAAALGGHVLQAQQASTQSGEGGEGDCFRCITGTGTSNWWDCYVDTHQDQFMLTTHKLGKHPAGYCVNGTCAQWESSGTIHLPYTQSALNNDVNRAKQAVREGEDRDLIRAVKEGSSIRLSEARNAIQVLDEDGSVVFHAPLPAHQVRRIAASL